MNRNNLAFLLFTVVFTVGLMACNQSEGGSNNEEQGDGGDVVTLQMWGGVPPESGPQEVVDNWNEQNPDIQVEYTRFVNDDDGNLRLNTALQTGQDVDIFVNYTTSILRDRVQSGFVLDLSQYDDYDIEQKMGEAVETWKVEDSYYALPTKQNADFVFLNLDAMEEAGLEVPETWDWYDLQEYAREMNKDGQYGYIEWTPEISMILETALLDEGWVDEDGRSNLDHPNVREAFQLSYEMMNEDESVPSYGERISTGMAPDHMFLQEEVAMFAAFEGILRMSNDLEEYPRDFVISFARFPQFEGTSDRGHRLGDALAISSESDYPDEAWEFLKWYADEGMLPLASGGRVPSSVDAPIEDAISQMVEGVEDTYDIDALERMFEPGGTIIDTPPLEVEDLVKQEYERYVLGDQDLDETIENLVERHNQYLDQN